MSAVIQFPRKAKALQQEDRGAQYLCLNCDSQDFHAYANARVYCAHCGARIRNLFVQLEPTK